MKFVTAKQIQRLDDVAINTFGIPSVVLMENAGREVFLEIVRRKSPEQVCVVCGMGNNAGDGFVVARHLLDAGIRVNVLLVGYPDKLKKDALLNYQLARRLRVPIYAVNKITAKYRQMLSEADITVDALFGVGLNRALKGVFADIVEEMNSSAKRVIAVDIPSGLDATTGAVHGCCVKAQQTITFSYPKKGFQLKQGPKMIGRVKVVDIGIPQSVQRRVIK